MRVGELNVIPYSSHGFFIDYLIHNPGTNGELGWCLVPIDVLNPSIEDCVHENNGYKCVGSNP